MDITFAVVFCGKVKRMIFKDKKFNLNTLG